MYSFIYCNNPLNQQNAIANYIVDTFQDFLIAEHMKPRMHILEISIFSLNHVNVRPTKTPKLADKKCAQFYYLEGFKNRSYQKMPITTNVPLNWYSSIKKKFRKIRIIFDIENSL
jgi:hypothetical protein